MTATQQQTFDFPFAIMDLTPHMSGTTIAAIVQRFKDEGKYTAQSVFSSAVAVEFATDYARSYKGTFPFMLDMKEAARRRPLSGGMVAAILNSYVQDHRFIATRLAEADRPKSSVNDFDARIPVEETVEPNPEATIKDGYYTVVFEDGSHLTLRVRISPNRKYQRVAALIGPANEHDYMNFGFIRDERFKAFSAFVDDRYHRWHNAARMLIGLSEEERKEAGLSYARASGNCSVCGHVLTDPISIELGIGPVCRERRT